MKYLFIAWLVLLGPGCVTEEAAAPASDGAVDINTRDYPYISYFTAMRGAIENKWNYPPEAVQQNHEGNVEVEYRILKNGQVEDVKVRQSSGHKELDDAIVQAIKAAAPFLPLPVGFHRDQVVVKGTFQYVRSVFEPDQPVKGKKHRVGPKKGLKITP